MQRFLTRAPVHVRKALAGRRLHPGYERVWPKMEAGRYLPVEPSRGVANYGFTMEHQKELLDHLGKNPLGGYGLIGPTGVGKTLLLYALAHEAIWAGRRIYFFETSQLLEMLRRDHFGEEVDGLGEMPRPEKVNGKPVHLFLEEFGDVPGNEVSQMKLFEVVNWCHNYPDKVVLSFACDKPESELLENYGPSIMRRITSICTIATMKG